MRTALPRTVIVDPANTNNVLSELLSDSEKEFIGTAASRSAAQQYWEDIIA